MNPCGRSCGHPCSLGSFLLPPQNPPTDPSTSSGPLSPSRGQVWAFESGEELSWSHCPRLRRFPWMYPRRTAISANGHKQDISTRPGAELQPHPKRTRYQIATSLVPVVHEGSETLQMRDEEKGEAGRRENHSPLKSGFSQGSGLCFAPSLPNLFGEQRGELLA